MALYIEFGNKFLHNIVTEDETPLCLYVPGDRQVSKEWKFPGKTETRKLRSGTSHRKAIMLSVFWDSTGIIHVDFANRATKINGNYYASLLETTRSKRRKPYNHDLYLLHDNAPVHTSNVAQRSIERNDFVQLPHPPYSPDLAPSDFYLFGHLKRFLKGKHFVNIDALRDATEDFFSSCTPEFFEKAFDDLIRRWKKCIELKGLYVEK